MRILVVEDEILIRMTTVDMVEALGHEVLEAGNADEALNMVADQRVDVVFTDIGLPGRSGKDLAREIRMRWPHIKIIFATGHTISRDEIDANLHTDMVTIGKPYDEHAIESALVTVERA